MKMSHFRNKQFGVGLILSLLLGLGFVASNYANSRGGNAEYAREGDQYQRRGRNWDGYRNYGGSNQLRQTALNAGYNEGNKKGRDDYKHRRRYDFESSSSYQKADKDYSSKLGDKETYRRYFRDAFKNGYEDGFRGY
jgi:hypothetical protein